jgi:hypothetical protein
VRSGSGGCELWRVIKLFGVGLRVEERKRGGRWSCISGPDDDVVLIYFRLAVVAS